MKWNLKISFAFIFLIVFLAKCNISENPRILSDNLVLKKIKHTKSNEGKDNYHITFLSSLEFNSKTNVTLNLENDSELMTTPISSRDNQEYYVIFSNVPETEISFTNKFVVKLEHDQKLFEFQKPSQILGISEFVLVQKDIDYSLTWTNKKITLVTYNREGNTGVPIENEKIIQKIETSALYNLVFQEENIEYTTEHRILVYEFLPILQVNDLPIEVTLEILNPDSVNILNNYILTIHKTDTQPCLFVLENHKYKLNFNFNPSTDILNICKEYNKNDCLTPFQTSDLPKLRFKKKQPYQLIIVYTDNTQMIQEITFKLQYAEENPFSCEYDGGTSNWICDYSNITPKENEYEFSIICESKNYSPIKIPIPLNEIISISTDGELILPYESFVTVELNMQLPSMPKNIYIKDPNKTTIDIKFMYITGNYIEILTPNIIYPYGEYTLYIVLSDEIKISKSCFLGTNNFILFYK